MVGLLVKAVWHFAQKATKIKNGGVFPMRKGKKTTLENWHLGMICDRKSLE
jgi:hypothetical protein